MTTRVEEWRITTKAGDRVFGVYATEGKAQGAASRRDRSWAMSAPHRVFKRTVVTTVTEEEVSRG